MSEQRILFAKYGTAKYISHLDLMHTMERAFLRAGIAIRHTAGFHPHPYVSIPLPLPLGFSSQCEIMEFGLVSGSTTEALPAQMNRVLPAGIEILRCYEGGRPFRDLAFVRYEVTLELDGDLAQQGEAAFRSLVDTKYLKIPTSTALYLEVRRDVGLGNAIHFIHEIGWSVREVKEFPSGRPDILAVRLDLESEQAMRGDISTMVLLKEQEGVVRLEM